jgi:uroporphyrinogen-III synthase
VPVLEIEATGAPRPASTHQYVFFLSEQAVRHGGDLAFASTAVVYAVGRQTAARLHEAGIQAGVPGDATSEGLIEHLKDVPVAGADCLIVAGEDGRKTLAQHLAERGARVSEYLCYRRVPADVPGTAIDGVTHILVASQDGFRAMARLWCVNGGDADVKVIVASNRIAALGPELGFSNLFVAAGASDADFIAALEDQ